jgi:hypothetical protein
VYHAPDGRIWLDILETLVPTNLPDLAKLVVYQRIEMTDALSGPLGRPQNSPAGRPLGGD